jgi:ubiquinol-cytochrome c reductase cytochrome b subunit/menaquinol-cytochrome c reductase cytochrome b/c subunit
MKPPSSLSASQKQTFYAGAAVVGQSGCLACHQLGSNGNNGPGPILTHIGSLLEPQAIASTLINPTPPMPSFKGLEQNSPQKFNALVGFLSELQ